MYKQAEVCKVVLYFLNFPFVKAKTEVISDESPIVRLVNYYNHFVFLSKLL